jgi:lysine 6-dehydrogenase
MDKSYLIVGAGMQGTAASFDLARFGDARTVTLVDVDPAKARSSANRVNELVSRQVCTGVEVDLDNPTGLPGNDVVLSCVPYTLHTKVEQAAFEAGCSVVDMGNDTDVTLATLARDAEFQAKGITLVPDTGLAPGLVNSIATSFIEQLDEVDHIRLYCGGLPQRPKPPFNYTLRFSVEGLVGEYVDEAIAIRNHAVVRLETLTELETVEIPGFGTLEAFTTSSGTSTAPFTFADRVTNYEYKTLRYPGHCAIMQAFQAAGFWGDETVTTKSGAVKPIELFHKLAGDYLLAPDDPDLLIVYATAEGKKDGRPKRLETTIIDRFDEETRFTAMERMTGFTTAIIAIEVAHGRVRKGCVRYELATSGKTVLDQLRRRGIEIVTKES